MHSVELQVAEMLWFVVSVLVLCVPADGATAGDWCYHIGSCNDTTWATNFAPFCNGTRQSPLDIQSNNVTENKNLKPFTFTNYNNDSMLKKIENTGKTVKIILGSNVKISEGGLGESYDSLQFHLHWGNGSSKPGSEHMVDGVQYPMELHIVNIKSRYNGNTTLAVQDSSGLAALGFFVQPLENTTDTPESWKTLTSYLSKVTERGQSADITDKMSIDSLLNGIDVTSYYRYNGSLTTPSCQEAVVWTVFKEPIKISKNLIDLFSTSVHVGNTSTPLMIDVWREVQNSGLPVESTVKVTGGSHCAKGSVTLLSLAALCLAVGWS